MTLCVGMGSWRSHLTVNQARKIHRWFDSSPAHQVLETPQCRDYNEQAWAQDTARPDPEGNSSVRVESDRLHLKYASLIQLAEMARSKRVKYEFESHERYLRQTKAVQEETRNPVSMVYTYGKRINYVISVLL